MKLLGANDDMNGCRGPPNRTQDDASVGYGYVYTHKQPRWATGDDAIIDVSMKLFEKSMQSRCICAQCSQNGA